MIRAVPSPFFEAAPRTRTVDRRLLLVSYCFPPDTTVGALRWQKFSRYALEYGFGLDVLTLDPSCLKRADWSRLSDLAPGTRVFGVPAPAPLLNRLETAAWRTYRAIRPARRSPPQSWLETTGTASARSRPDTVDRDELSWIPRSGRDVMRGYFACADLSFYGQWAGNAARTGVALSRAARYDAVVTSGPPHLTHEAGERISAQTGLPFVADLRDPWSLTLRLPESIASPITLSVARRHERRVLHRASLIVANTPALMAGLAKLYPDLSGRMVAVRNGADDDPIPPTRHNQTFTIAFGGTVYFERDPRLLMRGLGRVVRELGLGPEDIRLELIGAFDGPNGLPVRAIAHEEGVDSFVHAGPGRTHREALEFFAGATMLVTFPGYNSRLTIPAKLFEYVRFDAWVLALSEAESPTADLLAGTNADVVAPGDVDGIAAAIGRRYRQHVSGVRPAALASDGRFSRREQAAALFQAIERCLVDRPLEGRTN